MKQSSKNGLTLRERSRDSFFKTAIRLAFSLLILLVTGASLDASENEPPQRVKRAPNYTGGGAQACLSCHSGEKMRAIVASVHGNAENPDTPAAAQSCESCHGPGSIHVSRAHGGRGFPPLTTFGRGKEVSSREEQIHACMACHVNDLAGAGSIDFFGSVHDKPTINCSTCHTVHSIIDPLKDREQQFSACRRCHRKQIEAHPRFADKSINFDALSCSSCHDVHWAADLKE